MSFQSMSSTLLLSFNKMEPWMRVSLKLCIFGLLKEFRPAEPFITEYLLNPPMNFTSEQVSQEIYPISTYANLIELVFVFLVTDYLRYKPVIVLDALSGLTVYVMLITCRSLFAMQVVETMYGLFMAGEVAYYTYIYAKVEKEHFHAVTSHTRTAYLVGRAISGIVSQLVISMKWLTYYHLQYLTAGGLITACAWAMSLPTVENSVYFHRNDDDVDSTSPTEKNRNKSIGSVFLTMLKDLKHAFSNMYVLNLLVWSVTSTAGAYQVINYSQLLWDAVSKSNIESNKQQTLWNGGVETAYTLLGALATFSVGKIKLEWHNFVEPLLVVNALIMAVLLFVMSQTLVLWVAYTTYIVYLILYQSTITIVNSEIAKNLREDSYGLIFGVAMFFSLLSQTILTAIFVSKSGFGMPARKQFVVYGYYFIVLSSILFFKVVTTTLLRKCFNKGGREIGLVLDTS